MRMALQWLYRLNRRHWSTAMTIECLCRLKHRVKTCFNNRNAELYRCRWIALIWKTANRWDVESEVIFTFVLQWTPRWDLMVEIRASTLRGAWDLNVDTAVSTLDELGIIDHVGQHGACLEFRRYLISLSKRFASSFYFVLYWVRIEKDPTQLEISSVQK
jgi:hypothetical protein